MGWHAKDESSSWVRLGWDDDDGPESAGSYADAGSSRRSDGEGGRRGRGWQVQWQRTPWWSTTSRVGGSTRRPLRSEVAEDMNHLPPGLFLLEGAQKAWRKHRNQKGRTKR